MINSWLFYGILIVALVLLRMPYIGIFLSSITTLIHEMAHGMMALIMGGSCGRMEINQDRSGSIKTTVKSSFGRVMVSLSGYILTAVVVLISFFLIKIGYYDWFLFMLFISAFVGLLFFIKNAFGVIWLITFCTADVLLMCYAGAAVKMWVCLVLALVMFAESIVSVAELLLIAIRTPEKGGDAKNLANEINIPVIIWALLIFVVVGYISYRTVVMYFPYGNILAF